MDISYYGLTLTKLEKLVRNARKVQQEHGWPGANVLLKMQGTKEVRWFVMSTSTDIRDSNNNRVEI